MAGLGETCSHVATLLWAIAAGIEKRNSLTVTQKSAYWVMPPAIKQVPYTTVAEIDFIGRKRKRMIVESSTDVPVHQRTTVRDLDISPTDEEKRSF